MWIVRLALRRPYTFVVGALVLLLVTPFALLRTPTDILPSIDIPVVSVIWLYNGLSAKEMEERIAYNHERVISAQVGDIEHIESSSYSGAAVIKVFFQPGASVDSGVAQITASAQSVLRILPPGITPPLVIRYNASTVPILQYSVASTKHSEQELQDLAQNQIRVGLATVRGASIPLPYGGKTRVVAVDLDLPALQAKNLAPTDVLNAFTAQNLVLPSGTTKIGPTEYEVALNGSPAALVDLNELPVRAVGTDVIRVRDVAQVHDGYLPQQNIVRLDGVRGVLLTIMKSGSASTLSVVRGLKEAFPRVLAGLPEGVELKEFADQSVFVRGAVSSVVREGVIAAALTAALILLFLGTWRGTLIIALSIPLSIFSSLLVLGALGQSINLMTLGGFALAVGILVDDATVAIENIHRQMATGKALEEAILVGAEEIALPAFVSTLSICIVFVPMFFLSGVVRYLFVPLAEAVVFAMLASYVLSRTLVPTLVMWFYRGAAHHGAGPAAPSGWARLQKRFERGFERLRESYRAALARALGRRATVTAVFLGFCGLSLFLVPLLGRDFFPSVDAGQFRLHVRARGGTRIEETARLVDHVEASIRSEVPPAELAGILDNIGVPAGGIPLAYADSGLTGAGDADILVSLRHDHHPTDRYVSRLRRKLGEEFPGTTFYFLPADIVNQTINFGLPAPFDVQLVGRDREGNRGVATRLAERIRRIPGAVDVRLQQPADQPRLEIAVDRTLAAEVGLTERDAANAVLLSLSGSSQVQPNFWVNPRAGVQYPVNVRVPERAITSLASLQAIPVGAGKVGAAEGQLLMNIAGVRRASTSPVFSHYDIAPVIDVFGGVSGRDLGAVLGEIDSLLSQAEKELPRGSIIRLRGQAGTMRASFSALGVGLAVALVLVYLLLVVNFQSWIDPLVIVSALPGALAGTAWGLYLSFTTLSIPALMGAIMTLGVATANSVLVVSFARRSLEAGANPLRAALDAGVSRLRPVLMTALAMIIGMVPMSLALGDAGEQNAPLGRAVIGGLAVATLATLFLVPVLFSLAHRARGAKQSSLADSSPWE